jgi:hypothetical protein
MAKETHETIGATLLGTEMKAMEHDLQKLRAKYSLILKNQESLVAYLTLAVDKQSDLNNSKVISLGFKKSSSHQLKSQINDFKKRIDQINLGLEECKEHEKKLMESKKEFESRYNELISSDFHTQEQEMRKEYQMRQIKKQLNLHHIIRLQTRSKKFQDIKNGKYKISIPDKKLRALEVEKQKEKRSKLETIFNELISGTQ